MSGALLQLAALGSQDVYLTGNPEITLFKSSYQRHTHFSLETIQVSFDGDDLEFGDDKISTATIDQSGDLISKMVLVIKLGECTDPDIEWGYVNKLAHALINNISINIGQIEIDTHNNQWINIYHDLFGNLSHEKNYFKMIGNTVEMKELNKNHGNYELYIPLEFWTSKASSSAFPVICLNKQEFQIKVTLNNIKDCINYKGNLAPSNLPTIESAYFLVDYIFLDTPERNLFLERDHEYLIEQVQEMSDIVSTQNNKLSLIFDKPCKYILWTANLDRYRNRNEYLVWATDDNWDKALENFAKLVWLSTRTNLNVNDINNPIIDLDDTFINIGESIPMISGGLPTLEKYANKVKAVFLFAEENNVTNTFQIKASVDNIVIIENTLTFEDISRTITELKEGLNTFNNNQLDQATFLDINKVSIIDTFNYGNFINRKDNPIISTRLQFNGKDKFQERDGNFFNYLNPFYYFNNTPPDGLNAYSFGLNPSDIQPSGTVNFSAINNKELTLSLGINNKTEPNYINNHFKAGLINIYAVNYTMLKVSTSKDVVGLSF
jgi:hypothetical protein